MAKNKTLITILILAALVSFISFFRLEDFYHFAFDQERDYQAIAKIASGDLTLLGQQALSSTAFFLGPYYYYLSIPFYLLAGKQPAYGALIPAIVNLITAIYIFFLIYRNTKNRPLSFLAALFWASILKKTSWNVAYIPLISLAIIDPLTREKVNKKHLFFFCIFNRPRNQLSLSICIFPSSFTDFICQPIKEENYFKKIANYSI